MHREQNLATPPLTFFLVCAKPVTGTEQLFHRGRTYIKDSQNSLITYQSMKTRSNNSVELSPLYLFSDFPWSSKKLCSK